MEPYVKSHVLDKVATLEFYHPKGNAMNSSMLTTMADEITVLGARKDLNVIVIQSKGTVFCSGAFFNDLMEITNSQEGEAFFTGFAKVILAIKTSRAIVVSKVQGKAVGGAVGIIAASDYVISKESSSIRLSELSIGIGPFVISPVIKSKISVGSFMHLALNPKLWFDSLWCVKHGLFNESHKEEEFEVLFQGKINELISYSTEALHLLKQEGRGFGLENEMTRLAKVSGELVTSDQTKKILKTLVS